MIIREAFLQIRTPYQNHKTAHALLGIRGAKIFIYVKICGDPRKGQRMKFLVFKTFRLVKMKSAFKIDYSFRY